MGDFSSKHNTMVNSPKEFYKPFEILLLRNSGWSHLGKADRVKKPGFFFKCAYCGIRANRSLNRVLFSKENVTKFALVERNL